MKVLVIGSGGREHALAWKLAQSPRVSKIFITPGNPGTAEVGENIAIGVDDIHGLASFAEKKNVDLTVVGPEAPLVAGITDAFEKRGLRCFGPNAAGAQLEGSKAFSKKLFMEAGIPTAAYHVVTNFDEGMLVIENRNRALAIKADGLAAGKGVILTDSKQEAELALRTFFKDQAFGDAAKQVVIEDFLIGEEASVLAFTDGETVQILPAAQDHKAVGEGDTGPNTGGMGAYSPTPAVSADLMNRVRTDVLEPTLQALQARGICYRGMLYAGLMLTADGPMVLEYNCRFGDPETQPLMVRLESDLSGLMMACLDGTLAEQRMLVSNEAALAVVAASEGYPGSYEKGRLITGVSEAAAMEGVEVFHAGTKIADERLVTSGGRVLAVVGRDKGLATARERAYEALAKIHFNGIQFRRDIGWRALEGT